MTNMYIELEKNRDSKSYSIFGKPTKLPWVLPFPFYCVLLALALTNWNTISLP